MIAENVYYNVKKMESEYANNFEILINKPYSGYGYQLKYIELINQANFNNNTEINTNFDEILSDKCFSLMFKNNISCETNERCIAFFLNSNASGKTLVQNYCF